MWVIWRPIRYDTRAVVVRSELIKLSQVQRTPFVSRVNNNANIGMQPVSAWAPRLNPTHNPSTHSHSHSHSNNNRQQLPTSRSINPPRTNSISDGSDNGMGSHSRPSRLSTLASHNSWPNSGTNVPTRGKRNSIVDDSKLIRPLQAKPSGRFRPPSQYNVGR